MRPRQRVTGMQRSSYLGVSPPLDIRVQRIRVLKLPMARRRLTTVPGPDPVMPAAHERASTDAHWSSCCTAPELGRSSRRWPNRRRVFAGTRRASATAERPTSRHILGLKLLNAKNDLASRPSVVRASAQVRPLTRRLAPSSRSKLALFFRSVPTGRVWRFAWCTIRRITANTIRLSVVGRAWNRSGADRY
jgi:hypothetical protein